MAGELDKKRLSRMAPKVLKASMDCIWTVANDLRNPTTFGVYRNMFEKFNMGVAIDVLDFSLNLVQFPSVENLYIFQAPGLPFSEYTPAVNFCYQNESITITPYCFLEKPMVIVDSFYGERLKQRMSFCLQDGGCPPEVLKIMNTTKDLSHCTFDPYAKAVSLLNGADMIISTTEQVRHEVMKEVFPDKAPKELVRFGTDSRPPPDGPSSRKILPFPKGGKGLL